MKINGKELEEHDNGKIIYYDNVLIKSSNLNAYSSFEYWVNYIRANPNFCGCQFHERMTCHTK